MVDNNKTNSAKYAISAHYCFNIRALSVDMI